MYTDSFAGLFISRFNKRREVIFNNNEGRREGRVVFKLEEGVIQLLKMTTIVIKNEYHNSYEKFKLKSKSNHYYNYIDAMMQAVLDLTRHTMNQSIKIIREVRKIASLESSVMKERDKERCTSFIFTI